jgi:hypothetical protein
LLVTTCMALLPFKTPYQDQHVHQTCIACLDCPRFAQLRHHLFMHAEASKDTAPLESSRAVQSQLDSLAKMVSGLHAEVRGVKSLLLIDRYKQAIAHANQPR